MFDTDDHLSVFEQILRVYSVPRKLMMCYTLALDFREIVAQKD